MEQLPAVYLRNIAKHRALVGASGAVFVHGSNRFKLETDPVHQTVYSLYADLDRRVENDLNVVKFRDGRLTFVDAVHSSDAAAQLTAEAYAERLISAFEP